MYHTSSAVIRVDSVDRVDAAQVILDEEVYDRISDDNCPDRHDFTMPDVEYWGGFVNNDIAAILTEDPFRDGLKIHFQVLKQYRWAARELFSILLPDGVVYCQIPNCFRSTINFVKKAGFREIETSEKAYLKNGFLHDRVLLRLDK